MVRQAFNTLAKIRSRVATLKRLGSPDQTTECRITPSNYFRFLEGPSHTVVHGREFIIPTDSIVTKMTPVIRRGDRLIDSVYGTITIDEIIEIEDLKGFVMGYRVRCE